VVVANPLIHESASSLHLLARALQPVLDHTPDPFLMNLKGPMKKGIGGWNAIFFFSIQTMAKMKSGNGFPRSGLFSKMGRRNSFTSVICACIGRDGMPWKTGRRRRSFAHICGAWTPEVGAHSGSF